MASIRPNVQKRCCRDISSWHIHFFSILSETGTNMTLNFDCQRFGPLPILESKMPFLESGNPNACSKRPSSVSKTSVSAQGS